MDPRQGELSAEQITKLFDHVRFRWLSYDELVAAGDNPYVPKEQLTTALLLRLGRHEQKPIGDNSPRLDLSATKNERLKPRKTFGVMFDYNEHKSQFHGIMWHIATAKVSVCVCAGARVCLRLTLCRAPRSGAIRTIQSACVCRRPLLRKATSATWPG